MSEARIGKVRMKAGGAEVRVIASPDLGEIARSLLGTARNAITGRNIVAYAVVALADNGVIFSGARTDLPDDMLMNRHAFVGMVAETVRDDLLSYETAREVVNRANGYD